MIILSQFMKDFFIFLISTGIDRADPTNSLFPSLRSILETASHLVVLSSLYTLMWSAARSDRCLLRNRLFTMSSSTCWPFVAFVPWYRCHKRPIEISGDADLHSSGKSRQQMEKVNLGNLLLMQYEVSLTQVLQFS